MEHVFQVIVGLACLPLGGLGLFYLLLKDSLGQGQSLGKRIYGLRVVDAESGEPCTHRQSLVRNLWLLIPFMPMVEVVRLAATGQRVGDDFGETRVIFDDDPPATALLASATLLLLSMGALILVSLMAASQGGSMGGFR